MHYIVPLGNKSWFVESGIRPEQIHEMDWWETKDIPRPNSSPGAAQLTTRFICCPAQHGSGERVSPANAVTDGIEPEESLTILVTSLQGAVYATKAQHCGRAGQ